MKTKLMAVVMMALLCVALFAVNSFAAEAQYTCTVNRVGGYAGTSGKFYVNLTATNGAFSNVYFQLPEGRLNQILAVLLTAVSNGSTVLAKVDPVAKTLSYIYCESN